MKLASSTALLIVVNAGVLLAGGAVSYMVLSHEVEANAPSPAPGNGTEAALPRIASIEDDLIMAKPIFRRSRQAIGLGETALGNNSNGKAEAPPPPASPKLVGVLRGPAGQQWVLLEGNGGGSRRLLSQGGDFEGWHVTRIAGKEVALHHVQSNTGVKIRLANVSLDTAKNRK